LFVTDFPERGAVILQGVSVGERAVVGANAFIKKGFPAHCVVAGVPPK